MIHNYLKYAWRNLKRQRAYTLVNILGLSLGITCSIVIFLIVNFNMSFDNFHSNFSKIYRITTELHQDDTKNITGVPYPMAAAFQNDFDFSNAVSRIFTASNQVVSISDTENKSKFEEDVAFADSEFFKIFNFPVLRGDSKSILSHPNTAIITQQLANKYFADKNPIGQRIKIGNEIDVIITAVIKNLPNNTDRKEQIYISFDSLKDLQPWQVKDDQWNNVNDNMQCFTLLKENVLPETVDKALTSLTKKYYNEEDSKIWKFKLQALSDIHFNPQLGGKISRQTLIVLGIIGLFLVITACVNFINLATAQAVRRTKEIGIRKTLGVHRKQLFWQFMTETAVLGFISLAISVIFVCISIPYLSSFIDISLRSIQLTGFKIVVFIPILLLLVIFLSGSYPAIVLSGFNPISALKGKSSQSTKSLTIRKGLVLFQFVISQLLIIGTLIIFYQMRYSLKTDLGFQPDALIVVPLPNNESSTISTLRNRLSQISGIENTTFFYEPPISEDANNTGIRYDNRNEDEKFTISYRVSDDQYVQAFGLNILAGRNLISSDTIKEYLVNEMTVRKLGLKSNEDILEKTVHINGDKGKVVGVVRDFHNKSLHFALSPLAITSANIWYFNFAVKVNTSNLHATLSRIENIWTETFPDNIYKYEFLDEQISQAYNQERLFLNIITLFSSIAIIIGCLGLYGLISFMGTQKTKEIGIRKVLGAKIQGILWIFGKELLQLLLIAILIASPIAWWAMNHWLDNFAYRINIGIDIYLSAMLVSLVIALFTAGFKSYRSAKANPLKSLRSE